MYFIYIITLVQVSRGLHDLADPHGAAAAARSGAPQPTPDHRRWRHRARPLRRPLQVRKKYLNSFGKYFLNTKIFVVAKNIYISQKYLYVYENYYETFLNMLLLVWQGGQRGAPVVYRGGGQAAAPRGLVQELAAVQ